MLCFGDWVVGLGHVADVEISRDENGLILAVVNHLLENADKLSLDTLSRSVNIDGLDILDCHLSHLEVARLVILEGCCWVFVVGSNSLPVANIDIVAVEVLNGEVTGGVRLHTGLLEMNHISPQQLVVILDVLVDPAVDLYYK